MPTYDYQCEKCGVDFELFQSFSEESLKKCPTKKSGNSPAGCTAPGKGKVAKVFSAPGISFKGSGFYKNDSRSSKAKSSSSESSTSGSAESSTSSDSSSKTTDSSSDSKSSGSNDKSTTSTSTGSSSSSD